jgi:tRNA A-37 threonylcarbamoyl transferase component Bud32
MPPPATANEFLELVRKSGVLNEAKFQELFPDDSDLPSDPRDCAQQLVSADLLTPFQASQLLAGKTRGFRLGPYKILSPLGQGGMGTVYLAKHDELSRKVALKVLHGEKAKDALTLERFLREARAAAALDHPNIVRLHDVGQHGSVRYLVMEYVPGDTLEALLEKGGAMGLSRAVDYIAQAAAGLQHAYEKGFVHRDIKPANLMLTSEGVIKILDMGLARSDRPSDKLTEVLDEGSVVGTPDFISPEQAMNAPNIDIRADIYSLGATFFALVTGKPPFQGSTTQKLAQHQMKAAPSLSSLDKTVPSALSAVLGRMLAKKPEDRFQTPGDVVAALAEWLPNTGAARVVAGLSGTDMAQTEKMQATLTGIVSKRARRDAKKKVRQAEQLAKQKQLYWIIGGSAAGLLLLTLIIVLLTRGGRNDGNRPTDGPVAQAPAPGAPAPGGPRPGAPTPAPVSYDRTSEGADRLVGHWKFTTPATKEIKDVSGLKQTGTVVGTVDWAELGDRAGLVFGENGGMVRIPDHRRLRFTREESFTLTAWLKAPDELNGGRWEGVITKPYGRGEGWYGIWLGNLNGQPTWVFGTSFTNDPRANLFGARATGTWQHVCIVQDAVQGTRTIYVDGRDTTGGGPGRAKNCDGFGDLLIGNCIIQNQDGSEGPEPFRGAIHEVKLYSRALTPSEILAASQKKD